jgi:dTDP-4-dehydrorhamnose reductase
LKILITGKNGQLGYELANKFSAAHDIISLDRHELDLAQPDQIVKTVRSIKPDLILNAAAYTAVDLAEKEADLAVAINGIAPGVLAEEANRLDVPIVHYSTDYVFDGSATRPYVETDLVAPLGIYGKSKLAGEIAVASIARRHLVMRVSWLYGNRRQNFMLTMLRLMRERENLSVVDDQIGSPTWVRLVADTTQRALNFEADEAEITIADGLYHIAAGGVTSWHGFASAILASTQDPARRVENIRAISTREYPTPAKRPAYSVLNCAKIEEALKIKMPSWDSQLLACITEQQDE